MGENLLILKEIQDPKFLKTLSVVELKQLCVEIRTGLIETVSEHGGHLSSNLGVVELTVALHRIFDFESDRLLFDVGHQSYTHKILTGRYEGLRSSLRQWGGTSGYQQRRESSYDHFEAGHAGTALSAAIGMAMADPHHTNEIVAVVGDSSMANGMAMEALNHLGHLDTKVIVVYNDNGMGISLPVGGIYRFFSKARSSLSYQTSKYHIRNFVLGHWITKPLYYALHYSKEIWRRLTIGTNVFEHMGVFYLGPVDGHDLQGLHNIFSVAKMLKKSVVVHVITTKGKGYAPAEHDSKGHWHGVDPFDIATGQPKGSSSSRESSWSTVFSASLVNHMRNDESLHLITPAMMTGSKLDSAFATFPGRCHDVGIAEEHAVTFASGLALAQQRPVISIYSTFLQRAYDQVIHDSARMKLPITYFVDRCGIVGNDGETHQGIFDVAFIRPIPHTTIAMPSDAQDAIQLIEMALTQSNESFFIRMPRGKIDLGFNLPATNKETKLWSWYPIEHASTTVLVTGPTVHDILKWRNETQARVNIAFARFYKPFDEDVLAEILGVTTTLLVIDLYSVKEGLFEPLVAYLHAHHYKGEVDSITVPSEFIPHGSIHDVYEALHLDTASLIRRIESYL